MERVEKFVGNFYALGPYDGVWEVYEDFSPTREPAYVGATTDPDGMMQAANSRNWSLVHRMRETGHSAELARRFQDGARSIS